MQRGRGGRGGFFGLANPFADFGGFGDHRSLMSSFFEKDHFEDPFFTRPFGSVFGSSMLGPSMFAGGSLFGDMPTSGFLEHEAPQPKRKGPIIKELSSDDEKEEGQEEQKGSKEKKYNTRKHARPSKEPFVQEPDDDIEERKCKQTQYNREYNRADRMCPQTQTFCFQSSTVTYGGGNGAYYTSSTTRRSGSDGLTVEECKEADTSTGKATHRIARGIHDKGHSSTRKLKSDGRVDTVQSLHNLNEDELPGFEEAWKGKAKRHLPGWNHGLDMLNNGDRGASTGTQNGHATRGWALPSTEPTRNHDRMRQLGYTRQNSSSGRK